MVAFRRGPVEACQRDLAVAPQQDRMEACPLVRAVGYRPDPGAASLRGLEVGYQQAPEAGYQQAPEVGYRPDLVVGYQRDREAACQRDQHPTTATSLHGPFSYESLGNEVLTNTQTQLYIT